ncbi:hypothetical protein WA026_015642 [Henosepilachna vigintioctopunctata]|uniref:DDE Tnp4 domain-containing protein n=1 Tax=Henosepilachna vigintioctopunctata TaxID=420089 RepID=A0AAW1VD90_9CUCU
MAVGGIRQQMEIFLRFVGDPGFQSGVAQDVCVDRTTANKTIKKEYPSINVQATCNSLEQFTNISAECPGSVHDGRVWRNSHIIDIVSQYDGAVCLLGDSRDGLSPWLITPDDRNAKT